MNTPKRNPGRRRPGRSTFTTKSGNTIKINHSLSEKLRASRDDKARRRAAYLSTLPQNPWKRLLYRLHPKRLVKYWFSREGAIMALKIFGIAIVVGFILLVGVFAYFRKDLPNIKDISGDKIGGSITYYDRTGQTVLWQDYNAVKRIPVPGDQISKYMKQATISIEDKNFYNEGAFSVRGISRAAFKNATGGGGAAEGGSTITQQLVKLNQDWTKDRTITRKIKELILAVNLEREYSKDDILTGYLNIAPYGGIEYGVESAARDYFGTTAKDLTLAQATMLAAIPQSPSYYSPYSSPDFNPSAAADGFGKADLLARQHYILDQMLKEKYITKQQADEAKNVDILAQIKPLQQKYSGIKAPYFVLAAKQQLEKQYGAETVNRGGWKVTTTLNMDLQTKAEQLVADNQSNVLSHGGDQQALVLEEVKTGQMAALVGGVDFNNKDYGQINYAQTKIPPGSSFKPYDYVSMINSTTNTGAGSVLYDTQAKLEGYPCTNKQRPKNNGNCLWDYDFRYPGPLTLRYALGGSRNVPAVKAMLTVGVDKTIKTAEDLMAADNSYNCYQPGDETLTKESPCYASSAIGDGAYLHLDNHVNGLASLSRLGNAFANTYILKITDASNKKVYEWAQPKGKQVVRQDAAYIVNDILSDPKASYLSGVNKFHSYKGWKFAIKTGTTNDNYDGLMSSYSTQYAAISWVGYHTRNKELSTGMERVTGPLTRGIMQYAHDQLNTKPVNWTQPSDVKSLPAYVVRSHVGLGSVEPSPSTDLFPSWYKQKTGSSSQTIDQVSNKLATECTPEAAKKTVGGANANIFSADIFVDGGNNSAITASDDVHKCDDSKPSITVTVPPNCSVGSTCPITVTVTQGTHPLSSSQFPGTVNLYINGTKVQSQGVSNSPSSVTFNYTPTGAGGATIKAEVIDSVLYSTTSDASTTFTGSTTGSRDDNGDDNGGFNTPIGGN
jgi:membrane peptidoglycan carboxypeptidase